ncbi:hypothetical protein BI49514_03130 [Brevibacterium iodinum ATCC 49514]|uniref:Uncharacterized protein n=1 Tax=Brevibacterium iodinum ATCC 49514 TaxID=1255616 RepID=A0A2H1KKE7_9MICO|nr:hypothetical protein [Brevibacterium iodinum]SMY00283.1 hypothetical protein BI49514_03130 [Brevibacterium iodinum ATCC 49514]SUW70213.1 Uncharacterised protein [Brevibacterium iodinum]
MSPQTLRRLAQSGVEDFEVQIAANSTTKDDLELPLSEYRRLHSTIIDKLTRNPTVNATMFNRDETQMIAHLAQTGIDVGNTPLSTHERNSQIAANAHRMDDERRRTDFPQYNRATLEAVAGHLKIEDWDAHRKLAQVAVESGYSAEVSQVFINDESYEKPLQHSISILNNDDLKPIEDPLAAIDEDGMGGTTDVEQFSPQHPHGRYGPSTPFDMAPINDDEPGFPQPSDAHLPALRAQPPAPPAPLTDPALD